MKIHPGYRGKNAETAYEPKSRKYKAKDEQVKVESKVSVKAEEKVIEDTISEVPKTKNKSKQK
jgi:hypothetical protein